MGGCSIMMWGAFSVQGKSSPVPIRRMKSVDYQGLLQKYLLPFGEILAGSFWVFQQDNVSCHVSKSTKDWFSDNNVQVMD